MPNFPSSWATNPFSDSDSWPTAQVYWGPESPPRQNSTGALITIGYPHHEGHDGNMYSVSDLRGDTDTLADNATYDMVIWPDSDGDDLHCIFEATMGGDAEAYLYEMSNTTDADTDGTLLTAYNMNRSSTNTTTVEVQIDPTINSVGTKLFSHWVAGGSGPQAGGGSLRNDTEWILSNEKVYLARVINRAGTAQPGSLAIQWYEHSE